MPATTKPVKITLDRINLLKAKINNLVADERGSIKDSVRNTFTNAAQEAFSTMRRLTPERPDEPDYIYSYREDRWNKLGVQDYILNRSANRSVRLYGTTLKSGWTLPKIDFIGSTKGFINVSARIGNIAPHANMIFNGYKSSTWNITDNVPLRHGRQALMFEHNGRPFFIKPTAINFPVRFRAPSSDKFKSILQTGFEVINSFRDELRQSVIDGMYESSEAEFK